MNKAEKLKWLKQWYRDNRAELQTQPAQVAAIKNNSKVEGIIRDLYLQLFMKTLGGCGSCLADALAQLYMFPDERMKEIMDCKFTLKAGALLLDPFNRLPNATSANLTDEIAIAYLRDNIGRKDLFEKLPENLDELLAPEKAEDEITEVQEEAKTTKKVYTRKKK